MNEAEDHLVHVIEGLSEPMAPRPADVAPRLPTQEDIHAVLFDVYGTLLLAGPADPADTREERENAAVREALRSAGFEGPLEEAGREGRRLFHEAVDEHHRELRQQDVEHPEIDVRHVWRHVLERLAGQDLLDGNILKSTVCRVAVEYECRVNPVWPAPGVSDALDRLNQHGCVLGIVSNSQFYTPLTFRAFFDAGPSELGFREELCIWSWKLQEAKPSVRLYRRAASVLRRTHDMEPEQALYVGNDMLNDIWPASRMGFRTALFAGDRESLRLREDDDRCSAVEPDLVLTKMTQLPETLGD